MKEAKRMGGFKLRSLPTCVAPRVARDIYVACDTPFSRTLAEALFNEDYLAIVSAEVDPSTYTDPEIFRKDYLCAELMSKYPFWDLGIDREARAIEKFLETEALCLRTNDNLNGSIKGNPFASAVFLTAKRKIIDLLGAFSWDEASTYFGWGPGATTSLKRTRGDGFFKFGNKSPEAAHNLAPLVAALRQFYGREDGWVFDAHYVLGSKGSTVPKNAKTDRFIATEPDLNGFVQKGIGGVLRKRLNKVGLLLEDSQDRNQRLACRGSLDGSLATIDLSSASDTIARLLLDELLPNDWIEAIENCRLTGLRSTFRGRSCP